MAWRPNSGDPNWQTHACRGCPHGPGLLAHQTWRSLRREPERPRVDPWLTPAFKQAHPGCGRGALALAWLRETFAR
jgi:hypothetical protein